MRAAKVKVILSNESLKQTFIQELLQRGITEIDGQRLDSLDYQTLKHAVTIARIRETNIEIESNRWF